MNQITHHSKISADWIGYKQLATHSSAHKKCRNMFKSMNLVRYGRLLQNTPWFFSHQLFSFSLLETYKFKSFFAGGIFSAFIWRGNRENPSWDSTLETVRGGTEPVFMLPFSIWLTHSMFLFYKIKYRPARLKEGNNTNCKQTHKLTLFLFCYCIVTLLQACPG